MEGRKKDSRRDVIMVDIDGNWYQKTICCGK